MSVAGIGHNNPPEPTPFDLSKTEIENLFLEATHWLNGDGVKSNADADAISKLLDLLRKAKSAAEERRKAEAKPFDDGKAEVQSRYNPLIQEKKGKADLAMDACKQALAPWLAKVDAEKRAIAEAARKEAEEKAAAAQEALRAANVTDLQARADAEWMLDQAKQADQAAKRAEKDKASAKGGSRAITLRTSYQAQITDEREFARYCWLNHRTELSALFTAIAQRLVDAKTQNIPGVTVQEIKTAA